jgi:hypothetical protein
LIIRAFHVTGLTALLLVNPVHGQDRDFELPAADMADTLADGGLELADAEFTGSSLKRFAERWPDDLVIAPIPGRSPQVGWTLALAGGYFLESKKEDAEHAPSIIGGFGWYAENGSYAYGAGGNLHLLDDDLRVKFGAGYMDVRYRFYGVGEQNDFGVSLDILQEAPMYFGSASYRVWKKLYVGLGYVTGTVDTTAEVIFDPPLFPFFDPAISLDIGAITIPIIADTRDHEQFPRDGWMMTGRTMLYRKGVGSDFDAETFMINVNRYLPVREHDVLAFRGYFRTTAGDNAPFFIMSTFGGSTDLRGYPSGRYRDKMMYALQGEYRWQMNDKWIFTGFAGFGEVAPDVSEFGRDILPAAGLGARFVVSQKHRVSLSFDVARGKDGTEYYFGVGEAF